MNPDKENKSRDRITKIAAVSFWMLLWQSASMAVGEEILLASPAKVLGTIVELSSPDEFLELDKRVSDKDDCRLCDGMQSWDDPGRHFL